MRPTEAVALARYIKAHFPHQPVDEYTADALSETLVDYPFADCRLAVLNLADRAEEWCSPTAVKGEVKRIRDKRIAAYGPIEPPAGINPDDVRGWQRWLAEMHRQIADGDIEPPPPIHLGITRDVSELGHVGREIPPRPARPTTTEDTHE